MAAPSGEVVSTGLTKRSKNRGGNWKKDETITLLQLWEEKVNAQGVVDPTFKNADFKIYEDLSGKMSMNGFNRTAKQIHEKIKKMRTDFRKVTGHNGTSGNGRKSMEYYEELSRILGRRPAFKPHHLLQSGREKEMEVENAENIDSELSDGEANKADDSEGPRDFGKSGTDDDTDHSDDSSEELDMENQPPKTPLARRRLVSVTPRTSRSSSPPFSPVFVRTPLTTPEPNAMNRTKHQASPSTEMRKCKRRKLDEEGKDDIQPPRRAQSKRNTFHSSVDKLVDRIGIMEQNHREERDLQIKLNEEEARRSEDRADRLMREQYEREDRANREAREHQRSMLEFIVFALNRPNQQNSSGHQFTQPQPLMPQSQQHQPVIPQSQHQPIMPQSQQHQPVMPQSQHQPIIYLCLCDMNVQSCVNI